ncbi:MAG: hypothetical protein V2B18_00995 [Pseudomonadota bacterium]
MQKRTGDSTVTIPVRITENYEEEPCLLRQMRNSNAGTDKEDQTAGRSAPEN